MDEHLRQPLTLEEAKAVLRQQWIEGNPNLGQLVSQLIDSSDSSLIELVLADAAELLREGKLATADLYIGRFSQLAPLRDELISKLASLKNQHTRPSRLEESQNASSIDFFSQQSVDKTQVFDSNRLSGQEKPRQPLQASINEDDIPKEIGNFRIIRLIGEGTFGRVFEAIDKRLGRRVAIKVKDGTKDKGLSDDFLHEAKSISKLEHPNIVRLLQADETADGVGYLVYEFVDGEMLADRIKRGDYKIEECVEWIASIAEALDYAHRRGIVHRDISPRNIMITRDGIARLLDFGLSSIDGGFPKDDSNKILGTLAFMSPEQASGNPHWATSHSDIFSLGSVLYYALTHKLPFDGKSTFDTLERIQKASPAPPRSIAENIPAKLEEACLRALAKEPQVRFSTGADMSAALINSLSMPVVQHKGSSEKSSYVILALGVLVAIAGISMTVFGLMGIRTNPSKEMPEITGFDILADQGGPQRSLIYRDDKVKQVDAISQGIISWSNGVLLNVKAEIPTGYKARLFHCRYEVDSSTTLDELGERGVWACEDFIEAGHPVDKSKLALGPNILLLVCSSEQDLLPQPNELPQPLKFKESSRSTNSLASSQEDTHIDRDYLFHSKKFKIDEDRLWSHSYQLSGESSGSTKLLREVRRVWNSPSVSKTVEMANYLQQKKVAYVGVAFFVNE